MVYNLRNVSLLFVDSIILIILLLSAIFSDDKYYMSVYLLEILAIVIANLFIFQKKINLFEPIILFSAYYTTVIIAQLYLIYTDYETSIFINNTSLNNDIVSLTEYASFYYLIGYICTLFGYYSIRKKSDNVQFVLEDDSKISNGLLNSVIILFLFIGTSNFFFNVLQHAGGNIVEYLSNVSVRSLDNSSDAGYIFAYNGMYVWFFKIIRDRNRKPWLFAIFLIVTILMKASTGRIFGTLLYFSSFVGIYYFIEMAIKNKINNVKYFSMGLITVICGIVFYFLRLLSSLWYSGMLIDSPKDTIVEIITKSFGYYMIDKGNIPNTAVFIKIIDGWQNDIGFLYGQSLITWIVNFLPSTMKPIGYQPSVMIKSIWFQHVEGGALPPTGVGEMYANFGFLGPIVGMFLFGFLSAYLYNCLLKFKSYWFLVIYIQIVIGFIMLYPKGEFDNLTLLYFIPIGLIYVFFKIFKWMNTPNR